MEWKPLTLFLCPGRILEVARCSQLTDVGFTTLARVSMEPDDLLSTAQDPFVHKQKSLE